MTKVAGRRKLPEGKKARAENKGSTEFEMELVHYLNWVYKEDLQQESGDLDHIVFRSPASKTPVDVWDIRQSYTNQSLSRVKCYQCKTTKDTKPPRINKKEFAEFIDFVGKIGATGFWVDRWKKNKNVYIRRITHVTADYNGIQIRPIENFSRTLSQIEQGHKPDNGSL